MTIVLILCAAAGLWLLASFVCFMLVCYAPKKKIDPDTYPLPTGEAYRPYLSAMLAGMKEFRTMKHEIFTIRSFDGLTLSGRYYEYAPGAPMEIMIHGYRGCAERDMCMGAQRCFALGRNALIVDQRTSCASEGHFITFGIKEHRDCLSWVDFCIRHFGPDVKIILTGISMGASTAMMAAGEALPPNVVGVLADCGFTSARAIIRDVAKKLRLPGGLIYPLVRFGTRVFGGFDLESNAPIEAMGRCRVPVIFVHGEADGFVPCSMSWENYDACTAPKAIYTVPGADHGLSYLAAPEEYLEKLADFWNRMGVPTEIHRINIP